MKIKTISLLMLTICAILSYGAEYDNQRTITVDGRQRTYILYVPDNHSGQAPLVISLHGASGHATDRSPFRMSVADSEGCIVAYPQGENQNFGPFGTVPGWDATGEENIDIRFFKAIIEDIAAFKSIDRNRIYLCGFSNGGMMTYAAAQVAPDVFAAFASISGFPLNEFHHRHTGARPVPFLHIHGKSDDFVKYSLMPIIRDNMVSRNAASPVPVKSGIAGTYDRSDYPALDDREGFPYVFIEVYGMWHADYTDRTAEGSSAQTMWNFMKQFTLDSPCDRTLKWKLNLDTDGFDPSLHGWKVDADKKRFDYGTAKLPNNADNNVYGTLQFEKGNYSLRMRAEGSENRRIYVKIEKMDGTPIFCKASLLTKDVVMPFTIDDYSECRMIIVKDNADDKFRYMSIHSEEGIVPEANCYDSLLPGEGGVNVISTDQSSKGALVYDLTGQQVNFCTKAGIYISNGRKFIQNNRH